MKRNKLLSLGLIGGLLITLVFMGGCVPPETPPAGEGGFNWTLIVFLVLIFAVFYFAYSFLYFLAPARKSKWRFISAGGTLATVLSIVVTLGFGAYIDHFGKYNALYGSIGALPVIMLVVYFNCLAILIGFELNVGILAARKIAEPLRKPKADERLPR